MNSIEHIMYRHGWNTGFKNVSRFFSGTTVRDVVSYVDEALRYGEVKSLRPSVYEVIHNLRRAIGVDVHGRPTSFLRVIIEDAIIRTAHPL